MKVIKKLNIPTKCFYDQIVESVMYDITAQTGQTISPSQIEGFEYNKKFGNDIQVNITILALEQDKKYEFMTVSTKNTFTTSYEIEAIDDESCQVCYRETVASDRKLQNLNDKLTAMCLSFFKKKRVIRLLQEIERSVKLTTG